MPVQANRRRPIARMWPPATPWSEHPFMLVARDTRERGHIGGRTPTQIVRQAPRDEARWMYRL